MKFIALLFLPFVFGIGFFAPLMAQSLTYFGFYLDGIDNVLIGLIFGGLWGAMAQYRGSWVWIKS